MTSSDRTLRERLDQMRGKPLGPGADEEELAERLARLTGKPNILAPRAVAPLVCERFAALFCMGWVCFLGMELHILNPFHNCMSMK